MLNLVKLHGSVDWVVDAMKSDGQPLPQKYARLIEPNDPMTSGGPAIVVGDREKLETEGPTLALLRGFGKVLRRADRLVIVGYSGADRHVNASIRDWVNARPSRTITVLDPGWPLLVFEQGTFRAELNELLGFVEDPERRPSRLRIIRATTKAGLAFALEARPEPRPTQWFKTETVARGDELDVTITNIGLDVAQLELRSDDGRTLRPIHPENAKRTSQGVLVAEWLPPGETVKVTIGYLDESPMRDWWISLSAKGHTLGVRELLSGRAQFPV